ncbi:hypothetical protein NQ318_005319 [Aromia moschata]|uniref:Kinectin n=1 Tax=Aromia moschata TaxID=1265417 RepID=A0AAV8XTY3_9CUCU|nr:hypothetical protein NQ318_005319 [Aromia moschata]
MDLSTPSIFASIFLLACIMLFLIYKFGIKEKSYEEALAEQRQQTNVLLGTKPKPKEKKNKKASRKLKEKATLQGNETDESENVENANVENLSPNKLHVEFKEEPEEVPVKEVVQTKLKRVKKVRPILVKKDKSPEKVILDVIETPMANHFEENPPKDDFELMRSNSTAAAPEVAPVAVVEKEIEEKVVEPTPGLPQTSGIVGNPGKEKKKRKANLTLDSNYTEVQLLIDLLLNKQLEAPAVIDDWSEGKSDPVQKLKRQLAEKEKALAEEQEALLGVQTKLKEIRAEQQAEKSQLQQKVRGLEEAMQAKQIELQASNNRSQVSTQKVQQLQTELNAEILKARALVEENAALQMQIQQFDVRLTQVQETDGVIAKLRADVEELSTQNQQLQLDLQQSSTEKEHQQHFIIQLGDLEKSLKQQLQQIGVCNSTTGEESGDSPQARNDWKIEISNLNTALQQQFEEKRRLEHAVDQAKEELDRANKENMESIKIIAQLRSELQQLKDEHISRLNGSSKENKAHEIEILNLTNELTSVRSELSSYKTEVQQIEKKYKAELESSHDRCAKIENELEEQKAKNNELRTKNWKVMEALNAAESRSKAGTASKQTELNVDKLTSEIRAKEQDSQKQFIQRLFPDIGALKAVSSEDWQTEFGKLIGSYVTDLKKQQKAPAPPPEKSKDVSELQAQLRHYKNIIDDTEGTLNKLQSHIEKEEINWRNQIVAKEAEIQSLLRKLPVAVGSSQCVPDAQGIQFAYKCVERSLPLIVDELQAKVLNLEQQLSREVSEKQSMSQEIQSLRTQRPQSDSTATIEKLSEVCYMLLPI